MTNVTNQGFQTMPAPPKVPVFIFDLDGTLADCTHRLHHIQKDEPDWDAFFVACSDDDPILATCEIAHRLAGSGAEIWVWTGRSSIALFATQRWLKSADVWYDDLRCRMHGDHTPDDELKESWLMSLSEPERNRIAGVFEDRKRVVDMWRKHGLNCYHVAEGDF